ncbi:MAG: hypothetical protein ISS53_01895 [Dehalococcoidia bacterium]|nr:hypothetical protein [Dehalococcoidia bacterium]
MPSRAIEAIRANHANLLGTKVCSTDDDGREGRAWVGRVCDVVWEPTV